MIRASKDLSQSSYFLATNSLHLTTFCLKYKPTVVACVCIHLACKWTQWTIPKSNDGKGWWEYVDPSVTEDHLDELTREFLYIIDRCPARLKKRIMGYNKTANSAKDAKRPRSEGQSSTDSSQQAGTSTQVDNKASSSTSVYDFSFDSKPASGFDQYSDSEDSKSEEPATQKSDKTVLKPEKVRVTMEEYKRKDRERKEKDTLAKQQQLSSAGDKSETGGLGGSRTLPKDLVKPGPKLLPGNIENIISSKERVPHGLEKLSSGQEHVNPSRERSHTGHDRIPHNREKRPPSQDKHLSGSKRSVPPHDKMHSGHTRGPSGPERLSTERSSGLEKPFSSHGRDPVGPLIQDQTSSSFGVTPQDKVAASALGLTKQSGSVKQKEQRRPELHVHASVGSSKESFNLPTEKTLSGSSSDVLRKEHGQRSYAQAVKTEKVEKEHGKHRSEQPLTLHSDKAVKHRKSEPPKESLCKVKEKSEPEQATQETLDLLNQISAEIMKDIQNETTNRPDPLTANPVPVLQIPKKEQRIAEDLMLKDRLQVPPSLPTSIKPTEMERRKFESDEIIADAVSPFDAILEERKDRHESKKERREDRERRREGHRSKKDDKRHKSHKHRHRSPGASHKHGLQNDIGEGSGDMAPPKKQRLEQAGSPHTVLTTSQGIKLKIKCLGNSFNNGSEHGREAEKVANTICDSPGSVSLKLNLSKLSTSPQEPGKERDSNHHHHHHHRSHHKHKSRHHRSKDGHRKLSHSPGPSSASDASPAISPSKRKSVEMYETAATLNSQSLLDLPMPPSISKTLSRHASPITKHGKRKRESNPPLPDEDVPPPPPPPPQSDYMLSTGSSLLPMQFSTIDASALYENFQPPLPSGRPRDKRPPPPPIPPPQRRPPLPP
eukprot:XP_011666621.1 PREDICTED: cyclin-T1 [Strongylocentrotus purpuratus]